jgi:pyruvate dehydrogenase E2 component (dihydrolipoamide acetyltransferase)
MPRLSDSMEEGTILRWLKHSGEEVRPGEDLAEIGTDESTVTYQAEADGVLEHVVGAGETVPIGTLIARLGEGVATEAPAQAPPADPTVTQTGTTKGDVTVIELTRARRTAGRRMAEAKATVPEFTLTTEIDMEACVGVRAQLKELELATTPTINDLVVKATGLALREHPRANASYKDGRVELYSRINVGVAVAAPDALVFPTIFDADAKPLGQIAADTRTAAERVRAGTIASPELSGATFTVSNLGMYGVTAFTPIINTPQAAHLAIGALTPRPAVHGGEVTVRHLMSATLVCDHRVLYGAEAAQLLARIRELLERPAAMYL